MNPFELLNFIKRKDNPFRESTKEEREDQRKREVEVKEGVKRMAIICNDMLNDQRYKEIANIFKDIETQLTELMIDCDEPDRDKFYLKLKEYQMKLRIFKKILQVPHDFVNEAQKINRTEAK